MIDYTASIQKGSKIPNVKIVEGDFNGKGKIDGLLDL